MTKLKVQNKFKIQIIKQKSEAKKYDLEDRTLRFAKDCIDLCKKFNSDIVNRELISQLLRSSGSIGANYREANDTITKKDFYHRIGICRREAKESKYWLELLLHSNGNLSEKIVYLTDEALQLTRIFASINNSKG